MKNLLTFVTVVLLAILIGSCSKQVPYCDCPATLPGKFDNIVVESSMKGWELYSWPEDNGNCSKWNYVLVPGTDRLKSYAEITGDAVLHVTGEQQLKLLLSKFPGNEKIIWIGETWLSGTWGQSSMYYGNIKLPPVAIKNEVAAHCLQLGLQLTIAP